jgi:hypothetical protein
MNKTVVNLNKCKRVVQNIIWNNWGYKFSLKKIRIGHKDNITYINGIRLYYFDKHHHYPDPKEWEIPMYLYLKEIDAITNGWRSTMKNKYLPKNHDKTKKN